MFAHVKGQEETRRPEMFVDAHGREYFANVDLKTGDPCEVLQPRGWVAPVGPDWFTGLLMPPIDDFQVVHMVPRLKRAKRGYQIEIDYDAWLSKLDHRNDEYDARLHDLAKSMSGGMGALDLVKNPPPALLHYIGPRPFPPRVFVEAMKAGNPWALGLTDEIPQKAVALLAELEPLVTRKLRRREHGVSSVDPLADDADFLPEQEEQEGFDDPFEAVGSELDDDLFGLEEDEDPDATGGKTVPVAAVGGRRKKKTK